MPIRIYDVAKKLGLDNKVVLAKAKALGLTAARVASSSLDRITAEYLELQIIKDHPGLVASQEPVPVPAIVTSLRRPVSLVTANDTTKDIIRSGAHLRSPDVLPQPTQPPSIPIVREVVRGQAFEPGSQRFERRVRQIIDQHHPFCALSNILLFHGERARFSVVSNQDGNRSDYAFELDHLLHRATDTKDVLTIVECKNQPITVRDERSWEVVYADLEFRDGRKQVHNVQEQIERQAKALRGYVNPLSRGRLLQIEVIVVSSGSSTPTRERQVNPWLKIYLLSENTLMLAIKMLKPSPLRVVQSDLLGLLRLGIAVPELGHPELPNAIAYIERCRRDLDVELFRAFEPTKERWAINGSAGMGKSVLLAYSLFVLTTDRKIQIQGENKTLVNFATEAANLNLPPLGQRGVYAFALKEKQRQVIEVLFRRFVDEFSRLSKDSDLGMRRAAIRLWTGKIPDDCHVLVLDEAHDLSAAHAKLIADWVNAAGQNRYILIACDRHQKLRLVGRDENIIDGISFRLKTKKLRLNYRNPFAVYSASLGLMFRWFAKDGPKVVPGRDDLQNGFGFWVEQGQGDESVILSMRNDAHPANSWSDCVSIFPSCEAALARLRPCRFQPQDVLWVRFDDEDEHFDYEQLSCFTYHNLNSAESVELADKYIKGQDFPVVVIEGFSEDMNAWDSPEKEQRMWQRRKELYVCSSRATAFLFFVPRVGSGDDTKMREEVQELVRQLSSPHREKGRTWRCKISQTSERRRMDVFSDMQEDPKASTAG
jgi:hypothetical protein